ncbi:three-Cys-motif partner protein [Marinobacterium sp. MBR-111]|jgi:three-Cys-motif partner protein|uniref:three-Cys-motif partner protein TcmP n=1 Tax=Marinobacterium sp. MBR-111 TaxID=3156463 RepID=UPI0033910414
MSDHFFGGGWTRTKLDLLQAYIQCYTTAMKNQRLTLHYIDSFAGTGNQSFKKEADLFTEDEEVVQMEGSVKIALKERFHHYHFIELKKSHFQALESIRDNNPEKKIDLYLGDANEEVRKLCNSIDWRYNRAVLFLDPYGMELEWSTLEAIRNTRAIDVWFLFPLSGLFRNAATKKSKLDDGKIQAVSRILGNDQWLDVFYSSPEPMALDLFDEHQEDETRELDVNGLESYVTNRLREMFPYVEAPIRLNNNRGVPHFSLYFAISNDQPKAFGLAKRLYTGVRKALLT